MNGTILHESHESRQSTPGQTHEPNVRYIRSHNTTYHSGKDSIAQRLLDSPLHKAAWGESDVPVIVPRKHATECELSGYMVEFQPFSS